MRSRIELARIRLLLLLLLPSCPEPAPLAPPVAPPAVVTPPPAPPPVVDAGAQPEAAERLPALVLSLGGAVEVRRGGTGEWVALAVGDPVQVGDKVRLAPDGQLELSFDAAEIKMHEGSELELTLLEPKEVRLSVTGTVEAAMPGGEVSVFGGTTRARARGGRLSFSYDGHRAIAGSLEGEVSLTAGAKTVSLRGGEFATAKDSGLSRPAKMPRAATLEVAWPRETMTNKATVTVSGRASPGARVSVGGRKVEPSADGSFEAKVALKPGRQTVIVTATDAFGRRVARGRQLTWDPEAPKIKGAVEYH